LGEALRARTHRRRADAAGEESAILLALDWSGTQDELVIGRHPNCDLVLTDTTVSRRHARLTFRDGGWVVRDLESTNGTRVNGQYVGRCRLRPGDRLELGEQSLRVD
jgi:pSer/pThr/pTyr-binding forkhead associated (FHA) protein